MLTRGSNPLSPEAAAAEADRIIASRGDEDDFSPELVRTSHLPRCPRRLSGGQAPGKALRRLAHPEGA